MRPALTFALQELREGVSQHRFELTATELDLGSPEAAFEGPILVELEIARLRDEFRVRGRVEVGVRQDCVRCLEPAEARIQARLEVLVRPVDLEEEDEQEPPEGILYHDGETFALAEEVRQVVLVEVPAVPLCSPECRGLCPRCGGNLNLGGCACPVAGSGDPRWSALAALKRLGSGEEKDRG